MTSIHDLSIRCPNRPALIKNLILSLEAGVPASCADIFKAETIDSDTALIHFMDIENNVNDSMPMIRALASTLKILNTEKDTIDVTFSDGELSVPIATLFLSCDVEDIVDQPWAFHFENPEQQKNFLEMNAGFVELFSQEKLMEIDPEVRKEIDRCVAEMTDDSKH